MKDGINFTVTHYQRKRLPSGHYSVEFIFDDVRKRLRSKAGFKIKIASKFSTGVFNRLWNTIEAVFWQSDINHVTGDIHYITMLLSKRRTILTILDCVFMNQGGVLRRALYKLFWLTIPIHRVSYVTAISQSTKDDILRNVSINADKIKVIPVAVSDRFTPHPRTFNKDCPVLLQIGTAPNKNLHRLIRALKGIPCRLVIIGRVSGVIKELLDKNNIDFINKWDLTDAEILREYIDCDLVTFVSTYEGFGMPIIEANCVERPVVAGYNSSMIEVGGDAACMVDALNVDDIRSGILKVIHNDEYRDKLIENGRKNKLRYDGGNIAQKYYDLYLDIYRRRTKNITSKPVQQYRANLSAKRKQGMENVP